MLPEVDQPVGDAATVEFPHHRCRLDVLGLGADQHVDHDGVPPPSEVGDGDAR